MLGNPARIKVRAFKAKPLLRKRVGIVLSASVIDPSDEVAESLLVYPHQLGQGRNLSPPPTRGVPPRP